MTRNILERIVNMSKRDPNFEPELLALLDKFEMGSMYNTMYGNSTGNKQEKKPSVIVTGIAVLFALVLVVCLFFVGAHMFLDIPFVENVFNQLPI